MKREIKFRAWDKFLNRMDYNPEVGCAGGEDYDVNSAFEKDELEKWDYMQYTGLKDKNGKDVYEGDLLMFNDKGYTEFGWGKCIGEVVWVDCSFEVSMRQPKSETFWDLEDNESWEIIGNIYENPDLLNNKDV